jgi:hypothetical protein
MQFVDLHLHLMVVQMLLLLLLLLLLMVLPSTMLLLLLIRLSAHAAGARRRYPIHTWRVLGRQRGQQRLRWQQSHSQKSAL